MSWILNVSPKSVMFMYLVFSISYLQNFLFRWKRPWLQVDIDIYLIWGIIHLQYLEYTDTFNPKQLGHNPNVLVGP